MLLTFVRCQNFGQHILANICRYHATYSPADRIKILNFDNKQQFGAVIPDKKKRGRPKKIAAVESAGNETNGDGMKVLDSGSQQLFEAGNGKKKRGRPKKTAEAENAGNETIDEVDHTENTDKSNEIFWMIERSRVPHVHFVQSSADALKATSSQEPVAVSRKPKAEAKTKSNKSTSASTSGSVKIETATKGKSTAFTSDSKMKFKRKFDTFLGAANSGSLKVEKFRGICPDVFKGKPTSIPFSDAELQSMLTYPLVRQRNANDRASINNDDVVALTKKYPSVSKVLQATMPENSRNALKRWKINKIAELGEEGFAKWQAETFAIGSKFHKSIENFLIDRIEPDDPHGIEHVWGSIRPTLQTLDTPPLLIEKALAHPELQYKGIVDCVSIVRGQISVIEWKTSDKLKPSLAESYDGPVQLCAYLGALNADQRYDIQANNGFFVVAYKNGTSADSFFMSESDVRKYWQIWLRRLQEFWIRTRDGTIPEPI